MRVRLCSSLTTNHYRIPSFMHTKDHSHCTLWSFPFPPMMQHHYHFYVLAYAFHCHSQALSMLPPCPTRQEKPLVTFGFCHHGRVMSLTCKTSFSRHCTLSSLTMKSNVVSALLFGTIKQASHVTLGLPMLISMLLLLSYFF